MSYFANNFIKKVKNDFCTLNEHKKAYVVKFLYDIKKFVIPILHCDYCIKDLIYFENQYLEYIDPIKFNQFVFYKNQNYKIVFLKSIELKIDKFFKKINLEFQYYERVKSIYSTMDKVRNNGPLIYDKFGICIIFKSQIGFYQFAWWIILNLCKIFKIFKIKDFIANPSITGYSAIHVIVLEQNIYVEIQIIYFNDMQNKIPHFKYKQYISLNNLYIEHDSASAKNKIIKDFKYSVKCLI